MSRSRRTLRQEVTHAHGETVAVLPILGVGYRVNLTRRKLRSGHISEVDHARHVIRIDGTAAPGACRTARTAIAVNDAWRTVIAFLVSPWAFPPGAGDAASRAAAETPLKCPPSIAPGPNGSPSPRGLKTR